MSFIAGRANEREREREQYSMSFGEGGCRGCIAKSRRTLCADGVFSKHSFRVTVALPLCSIDPHHTG